MPERSRMYFFIFETTIRTSRSATSTSLTLPSAAAAVAGDASPMTRRTTGAAGAAGLASTDAGSGGFSASSLSHACLLGARASTAHASRWRRIATWLSQHGTVQNTRRVRKRLHVDTLHTQCAAPNEIGFLHALHLSQVSAMSRQTSTYGGAARSRR